MWNFSVGVFVEIMPLLIQSFHFLNLDHLRSTNTPNLAFSSYTERQTIWLEKVKKTFPLFLIFIIFGGGNITLKFRFVFSAFWKWNWALYWNACLKPTKQNKTNSPPQKPNHAQLLLVFPTLETKKVAKIYVGNKCMETWMDIGPYDSRKDLESLEI